MKLFLLLLVSIISFSGLAQNAQSIVGSWNAVGVVCGSPGNFRVIALMPLMTEGLEITDSSIIYAPNSECEVRVSYSYDGSTLSLNRGHIDTSHCPDPRHAERAKDFLFTDWQQNVIAADGFLYIQSEEEVSDDDEHLPEGCTSTSVYYVLSPPGEPIKISR